MSWPHFDPQKDPDRAGALHPHIEPGNASDPARAPHRPRGKSKASARRQRSRLEGGGAKVPDVTLESSQPSQRRKRKGKTQRIPADPGQSQPNRVALKAPERRCKHCGEAMPPQVSSPGRPRLFCSRRCSRDWHLLKESYQRQRDIEEAGEARYYEMTRAWWPKRRCDQEARRRQQEREAKWQERERHLEEYPGS